MPFQIKFRPKGKKRSKNYDIIVMHRTRGLHSRALAKLGYFVKEGSNEAYLVIDKTKLFFWLKRGAKMPNSLIKYLQYIQ